LRNKMKWKKEVRKSKLLLQLKFLLRLQSQDNTLREKKKKDKLSFQIISCMLSATSSSSNLNVLKCCMQLPNRQKRSMKQQNWKQRLPLLIAQRRSFQCWLKALVFLSMMQTQMKHFLKSLELSLQKNNKQLSNQLKTFSETNSQLKF